jgi:ribonuclease P protein component
MREATRQRAGQIEPGFDLVFIARQAINQASYADIERHLEQLLKESELLKSEGR